MADRAAWGTSVGTLVLAGATFAAVRSSNRSARIAERALLAGLRPLLTPSRPEDPDEQVQFADGRVFGVGAGRAMLCHERGVIYLAIPLRNVGAGIAVLRGYPPGRRVGGDSRPRPLGRGAAPAGRQASGPARFVLLADGDTGWRCDVTRHWSTVDAPAD
jgi:hypothetical protein